MLIEPHQDPYCAVHYYVVPNGKCSCVPHGEVFPKNRIKPLWVPTFCLQRLAHKALETFPGNLEIDAATLHGICVELEERRLEVHRKHMEQLLNGKKVSIDKQTLKESQ